MTEEFETYADALWWGLVSHHRETSLACGPLVAERWRAGRGRARPGSCLPHSPVRARLPRLQTSSGRLPATPQVCAGNGLFRRVDKKSGSDSWSRGTSPR